MNCKCIANWDGRCVADTCKGQVRRTFDAKKTTPEEEKELYELVTMGDQVRMHRKPEEV